MITLDIANPGQISSPQSLSVLTNEPGVTLYIFTGIALTRMYNRDNQFLFWTTSHERDELIEVTVGRVEGRVIASAAQVSLARIWSHPGLFNLHLNDVWVEQLEGGEIVWKSNASMNGTAGLVGVSYQVNVKVLNLETELRGIVRWRPPHVQSTRETDLLDVGAIRPRESTASISGLIERAPSLVGEFMQVPFIIQRPPLGIPLVVSVLVRDGAFLADGTPSNAIMATQVSGPRPVTLTLAEPRRSDLVFELSEVG